MASRSSYATIVATGACVPENIISNAQLEKELGEPLDDWLVANVGIRERHFLSDGENGSDLVVKATREALKKAGITPDALDMVIVSTDTPDYFSPPTANVVQQKLQTGDHCQAFDVNAACAGWLVALDMATRYIQTDTQINHILVAGCYAMSRFLDRHDKYTATLFADGAGVAIMQRSDQPGFLASAFCTMSHYYDALGIYTGAAAHPVQSDGTNLPRVQFVKKFPKHFNLEHWPKLMLQVCQKANIEIDQIDYVYFTQLNLRTIENVMQHLDLPINRTHWIMDKYGYTGSGCVVMAVNDAIRQGKGPQPDNLVMFVASGGGINMSASLWRWR